MKSDMLVTYDLDSRWLDVKAAARLSGFRDFAITDELTRADLPNTTLLVEAASPRDATSRFVEVVRGVSPQIHIRKVAAFDWSKGWIYQDPANPLIRLLAS